MDAKDLFLNRTGILKEEGQLRDRVWLQDRLRLAANRRYTRLHRNCVKRITENGDLSRSVRSLST